MANRKSASKSKKAKDAKKDAPTLKGPPGSEMATAPTELPPASESAAADTAPPQACEDFASRDQVFEAVYQSIMSRGAGVSRREARRTAEDVADRLRAGTSPVERAEGIRFYNLLSEQDYDYPHGKNKVRMRASAPVMRKPEDVTILVLHQTAIEFGVSSHSIKASGGDEELAKARRALDVACHSMAFMGGFHVAAHPILAYVNHANRRLNPYGVGLEIEGNYPGLKDDPSTLAREDLKTTWSGSPTVLTDLTVQTACEAIFHTLKRARDVGANITHVAPHRISSDNRRPDPGQEIWERVAIDFCEKELGLKLIRTKKWTDGRDVPKAWDPEGKGKY